MNDTLDERKAKFFRQLEKLGQDHVQRNLGSGLYNGSRKAWAAEWVAQFDKTQREEDEEFKRDNKQIARSAKNAAWIAAIAAIIAAIAAIVALVMNPSVLPPS